MPFALREVRTVSGVFEKLLAGQVNIGPGIRSTASASQNSLRGFLIDESQRDPSFPRVLSSADSDFLGGSFARHTKTWPLDDIDVYLPLDGKDLFYSQGGLRLPYTVVSDNRLLYNNPLLGSRWMANSYVSSDRLLGEFAQVLRRHYPAETKIDTPGCSVAVRMSHGSSANSDGLGYDIVPCFLLRPDASSEFDFYLMPDGKNGWMRTNPRLDTYVADELQAFHNGLYRKIVKLVKYWNQTQLWNTFGSYYIELAISLRFWSLKTANTPVQSLSFGVLLAFEALRTTALSGDIASLVKDAPPVKAPSFVPSGHQFLRSVQTIMEDAVARELSGDIDQAIAKWGILFGESFGS